MPYSLQPGEAGHIHRYEGLPFLATDGEGRDYVLTPIFYSSRREKTFRLRELAGFTYEKHLFVEFVAMVPFGKLGRYVLMTADGRSIPLQSDDFLAP